MTTMVTVDDHHGHYVLFWDGESKQEMDIRRKAYKMDISSDAAEKLAKEVGEEMAVATLEKVQRKLDYQDTLPFHPHKRTAGYFFGVEAQICRMQHRARIKSAKFSQERDEAMAGAGKLKASGDNADADSLMKHLEKYFQEEDIAYKDFMVGKKFINGLEPREE